MSDDLTNWVQTGGLLDFFGVPRDQLEGLERVRKGLCCYLGDRCDCKYGFDGTQRPGGEQTGCPEIRAAMEHIQQLRDSYDFLTRALALACGDAETEAFYRDQIGQEMAAEMLAAGEK